MIKKVLKKIFRKETIEDRNPISSLSIASLSITDLIDLGYENFKTVFDIGAHHGSFTEAILNRNPSVEIHAFEPYNLAFEVLKNKFRDKNVFLRNCALGEIQGESTLHLNKFDETNSLLLSNSIDADLDVLTKNISEQKVNVITLDSYCDYKGIETIDLIKIDTQGNSYNVLLGATELLTKKRIKNLYVETEFIQIYKGEKCFSEIELFLRNIGYQLVNFYNFNYTQDKRIAWCDCLFSVKNK